MTAQRRLRLAATVTVVVAVAALGCSGRASAPSAAPEPTASVASVPPSPGTTRAPGRVVPTHAGAWRVVVLGDSVAWTLTQSLQRSSSFRLTNDAVVGCGVTTLTPYRYLGRVHALPHKCRGWPSRWAADVRRAHADVTILLVGRWEVMTRWMDGRWVHIGEADYDRYLRRQLATAFRAASSSRSRVVALTAPYFLRARRPGGGLWPEDDPRRVDAFNAILRSVATASGGAVIDLGRRMARGRHRYVATVDGVTLRYDGVHIAPAGARWLSPWLFAQLRQVLTR